MIEDRKVVTIEVQQVSYCVIRTAREGVDELDRVRREKGLSQMSISHMADMPDDGVQYYRMYKSGDVKISKFLKFLKATGYELMIMKRE